MTREAFESISPRISDRSTNVFGDPSFSRAFETVPGKQSGTQGADIVLDNPYPQSTPSGDGSTLPLLSQTTKGEIDKAESVDFTTSAENKASGATPDYRLVTAEDGKLVLEKVGDGDPLADGKLNIEVQSKDNESIAEAIKQADKNLKEYIREMMQYWQQNHPGKPMPGWWTDILNSQPNLPANAQPIEPRPSNSQPSQPRQVEPQDLPSPQQRGSSNPSGTSSGGSGGSGGGGGGGSGGGSGYRGGGGDGSGYRAGGDSAPAFRDTSPDISLNDKAPVAMQIMDYFIEKGLTKEQAAGIVGNLHRESGLDPGIEEKGNGIGYGLAQWSFGRRDNLEAYAREQGKPVSDLKLQLDFLWKELNTTESATLQAFKANPNMSASEAANVFEQKFERAGVVALGERQGAANQYLAMYENGGANGATAVARSDAPQNIEGAPARITASMIDGEGVLKPQHAIDTGIDGNFSQSMQTRDVVLAPGAAQSFKAAYEEAQAQGLVLQVNSSFRDADGQARVDSGDNPKAAVGHSSHNKGNAVDLANASDPRVERIMNKHGFSRDVAGDEPHYTYQPGKRAVPNSLNA